MQGNIALYNGYIDSLDKAVVSYNTNNFEYAYKYCSEVPDNELGVLAKEGYSDVIKNILNDYKYINDEPISATAANYITFTRKKDFPNLESMLCCT